MVDKYVSCNIESILLSIKELEPFNNRKIISTDVGVIMGIIEKHQPLIGYKFHSLIGGGTTCIIIFKRKNLLQKIFSWTPFKQ